MVSLIENNLVEIRALCDRFGLQKMFVFGSALDAETFNEESDIDLLYKLRPEIATMAIEERPDFFEMLFSFEELFGRSVDLVDLTRVVNPYFIQSVNRNKQKIYEA